MELWPVAAVDYQNDFFLCLVFAGKKNISMLISYFSLINAIVIALPCICWILGLIKNADIISVLCSA